MRNLVISLVLACALVHPNWTAFVSAGEPMKFFGIPLLLTTYSSTFIQSILTVWILSYVEKWVKKIIPTVVSSFFVPFIVTLIMGVIMFVATAPLGGYLSGAIETFVVWIKTTTGGLAPAIVTLLGPFIAMGGMHLALIPFAIQQITTVGYDDLINVWFLCFTISAGAVALAVLLKTKNKNLRTLAIPAMISGLFGGISEPTVYGISMKMVKPYWANIIASSIAALYAGLVHLKAYAFGAYSLTSLLAYMGTEGDTTNFIHACITVAIDIVVTIALVYIFGFDDSIYGDDDSELTTNLKDGKIVMPVEGQYIKQADLSDNTFKQGYLGACFGVKPAKTEIYSPVNGVVTVAYETKHAFGIEGKNGEEILVHIGIDSVNLKGEGLESYVKVGDQVTTNTKIASYDKAVFEKNNIDQTVIVALTNRKNYEEVNFNSVSIPTFGEIVAEMKA
jgi:PTS system beta-glucosides-specific IIC component